jgi:primosomal protein N' (replication factor Y)
MNPHKAEQMAITTSKQVQSWIEDGKHTLTELIGPTPCFFSKQNGYYRWQLILRGPDPASILRGKPLAQARIVVDPPTLL